MSEISQNSPQNVDQLQSVSGDLFPCFLLLVFPFHSPFAILRLRWRVSFLPDHIKNRTVIIRFPLCRIDLFSNYIGLEFDPQHFFGPGLLGHLGPEPNPEVNPGFLASAFMLISLRIGRHELRIYDTPPAGVHDALGDN